MESHRLTLLGRVIVYALLIFCAVAFFAPFAWMVSTSLKPLNETMVLPPVWIPSEAQWHNYRDALHAMGDFWRYAGNTIYLCVLSVIGTVVSSALAAYGFSRIEWKGRDAVFILCLATMMIPFPVIMVPVYTLFRAIGWVGTFKPLWVPSFLGSAFNIFLLRQFFMTIPKDLTEAARIDGCGDLRIFVQIILPISRPALLVVALFTFMYTWNDFLGPLIYLTDQSQFTLSLALQAFQTKQGGTAWHHLMAASTVIIIPLVLLFFFTQKTFIQGITTTGSKG
ncbi:MAG: carbohydrate ABC transporter permease [Verrucomicrobia bacterium]|nr:MAG: carbohydrate ABC transporter permease [Verrucomicrobiota bacterium]